MKGDWPKHPLESEDAPKVQKKKIKPLRQGIRAGSSSQGEPILGEGVGQSSGKSPQLHAIAGFSP